MQQGPGFYGKMPCRGDFVSRGLPRGLVDGFDQWFQQGMHTARAMLGDQWQTRYSIAPIWRFFISPGVFDQHAWVGVFIPSVDKVGRQFPCLIALPVPQRIATYEQLLAQDSVYLRVEDLLLDSLELDFNFDHFSEQVDTLALRPVSPPAELQAVRGEVPLMQNVHAMRFQYQYLDLMTSTEYPVLWMSDGTDGVEPQLLLSSGMPDPESFAQFIVGESFARESADAGTT
ncbi:MAG: type VI secretion system-associated protein TagF [Amphritea sp.]|nr:type VI secretion system-associated protein TagF [Amphritea sp.]